jgi:hypothetical protein
MREDHLALHTGVGSCTIWFRDTRPLTVFLFVCVSFFFPAVFVLVQIMSGASTASRRSTPAADAPVPSGSGSGMRKSVVAVPPPVELDDLSKKTIPPAEQATVDDKQQEEIDSHIQKKVTEAVVYLVFLIVFLIWSIRYVSIVRTACLSLFLWRRHQAGCVSDLFLSAVHTGIKIRSTSLIVSRFVLAHVVFFFLQAHCCPLAPCISR